MNTLSGKTVWITGASSGIGEALSYAFAAQGARLVLSARRLTELQRVKKRCDQSAQVELLPLDLNQSASLSEHVHWVIQKMGSIDILVNNAGLSQRSVASETTANVYREIMETNFFGTIQLSNLVLAHFLKQRRGHFVVISSLAGKLGLPFRTAYCASKHAIEGFYAALRNELWKTDIRILMVRPGSVKTNIAQHALLGDGSPFNKADPFIEKGIPSSRAAHDIVQAILQGKQDIVIGRFPEKMALWLNQWMPRIVFSQTKKIVP